MSLNPAYGNQHLQNYCSMPTLTLAKLDEIYRILIEHGGPTDKNEWLIVDHIPTLERHTVYRHERSFQFCRRNRFNSHENAARFIHRNEDWKRITGWVPLGNTYILYSVVEKDGVMRSVMEKGLGSRGIDFIPDPYITWSENLQGQIEPQWCGTSLKSAVRIDPEQMIEDSWRLLKKMYSGADPVEVRNEMRASGFPIYD